MYPNHLAQGYGEKVIGVGVAEISAASERKLSKIIKIDKILRLKANLIEFLSVERDIFVNPVERCLQPLELQLRELIP